MPEAAQLSTDTRDRYSPTSATSQTAHPSAQNGDRLQVGSWRLRRSSAAIAQVPTSRGGREDQDTLQGIASRRPESRQHSHGESAPGVFRLHQAAEPIPAYWGNVGGRGLAPQEDNEHRAKRRRNTPGP